MTIGQAVAEKYGWTLDELRAHVRYTRLARLADPDTCDWCDEELPASVVTRRGRWCPGVDGKVSECKRAGNRHPDLVT